MIMIRWYNSPLIWVLAKFGLNLNGICLFPIVHFRKDPDKKTITHELIHERQILETWVIGFYVIYLVDFIRNLCRGHDLLASYYFICFEREAYTYQYYGEAYLKTRERFAWVGFDPPKIPFYPGKKRG